MQIHFDSAFKCLTPDQLEKWIKLNYKRLIGSALFTANNTIGSKIVRWAESWTNKKSGFKPSHTGSIIEIKGKLYVFDMKPPRAKTTTLLDYLLNTKDKFALVMRDFELDGKMFSLNLEEHIGESYPYLSAIRSVFTKRQSKWRRHCSEMHLRELQKQGVYTELNPEITPDELFEVMCGGNRW